MKKTKRLDGKKKLTALTSRMETDIRSFCRDKGIENESELIRQAIAHYIYVDYTDETLNRHVVKQIQEILSRCQLSISFK